jgi:predicted site-specific integrase-resolvase
MEKDPLLTRKQISEMLQVTPTSVRNYEKANKLKVHCHILNRPRYLKSEVEKLMK